MSQPQLARYLSLLSLWSVFGLSFITIVNCFWSVSMAAVEVVQVVRKFVNTVTVECQTGVAKSRNKSKSQKETTWSIGFCSLTGVRWLLESVMHHQCCITRRLSCRPTTAWSPEALISLCLRCHVVPVNLRLPLSSTRRPQTASVHRRPLFVTSLSLALSLTIDSLRCFRSHWASALRCPSLVDSHRRVFLRCVAHQSVHVPGGKSHLAGTVWRNGPSFINRWYTLLITTVHISCPCPIRSYHTFSWTHTLRSITYTIISLIRLTPHILHLILHISLHKHWEDDDRSAGRRWAGGGEGDVCETLMTWLNSQTQNGNSVQPYQLLTHIRWSGVPVKYLRTELLTNNAVMTDRQCFEFLSKVISYRLTEVQFNGLNTFHRASTGFEQCVVIVGLDDGPAPTSDVYRVSLQRKEHIISAQDISLQYADGGSSLCVW